MVAIRDLKVSMDIAKMKELGWFPQEFIVYGCSYLEKGTRYYRISNQYAEISRFRDTALLKGIYPTPTTEWLNRTLVPSGMQKEFLTETKQQLALHLQNLYPKPFLEAFNHLAQTAPTNDALSILEQLQHQLIGCFDCKTLEIMQGLVTLAYEQKKLTLNSYHYFTQWIDDRLQQMADDMVIKKNIKRTLYGFGYRDAANKIKFFCNAYEDEVFKRREALISQQKYCSPIISNTTYYNQMPDMSQERAKFIAQMTDWMDETYWNIIDAICKTPSPLDINAWMNLRNAATAQDNNDPTLNHFLDYYQTLWKIT